MKSIEKLVKKVISESMNEKAEEMTKKIHDKLSGEMAEEWGDYDFEYEEDELTDKARFAKILKRAMERKGYMSKDEPKTDELEESMPSAEDYDYVQAESDCMEGDCGEMEEELHGNQNKIDVAEPKGKITGADFKKLRSMKKETDEEMEEGNAFSGALAKAKEEGDDTFEVDGKEYDVKNESRVYSIEFKGGVLKLTENELVDMIEELVIEQKAKSKGMVEYDRVHKKDEDINKKANQESFKKMKDYVKAGSKGNFEPNPKHFPKGNGELAKMDKKAYKASDAVEEYVDTFAYGGGMLDLDPDEIGYNEDWLEKTIEGSAMTGNSPEYANADDTGLGKKLNKRRKEGLYNQEKRQNSYKRVKQPVDVAGENTKSGKLNKMFKNLGESEEKKEILSEEMVRMKEMIGYNKKSQ
jgi:hypothetical protein